MCYPVPVFGLTVCVRTQSPQTPTEPPAEILARADSMHSINSIGSQTGDDKNRKIMKMKVGWPGGPPRALPYRP